MFESFFVGTTERVRHNMRGNDYIAIKNRPDTSASFFHSASVYDAALLLTRCITYERLSNRTTRVSARSMPRYKRNKNKATSLRIKVVSASSARELCQSASFPIHCQPIVCAIAKCYSSKSRDSRRLLSSLSCPPREKTRSISPRSKSVLAILITNFAMCFNAELYLQTVSQPRCRHGWGSNNYIRR